MGLVLSEGNNRNFLFAPPSSRKPQCTQWHRERREAQKKTQAKLVVAAEVGPGLSLLPSSSLPLSSCALSSYPGGQFPLKFSQAQSSNEREDVFSQPQDKPIDCNLENSVNHVKYCRTCSLGQIFRSSASSSAPLLHPASSLFSFALFSRDN